MAMLKISSPWIIYYNQVLAMFAEDPEVHVIYDEDNYRLTLYVDNPIKADALTTLMPTEKEFGNIVIEIAVVPSNKYVKPDRETFWVYEAAFDGNSALSYIRRVSMLFGNDLIYVVFANKVVQYFSDNLGDIYGMTSTLYQDLAKAIFKDVPGVYYCTDVTNKLGMPLGEWP